jgi:hypothetical protein
MESVFKILLLIGIPMTIMYVIAPLVRAVARNMERGAVVEPAELEALRADLEALRELHPRVAELEERVDFAERLLARRDESAQLPQVRE